MVLVPEVLPVLLVLPVLPDVVVLLGTGVSEEVESFGTAVALSLFPVLSESLSLVTVGGIPSLVVIITLSLSGVVTSETGSIIGLVS